MQEASGTNRSDPSGSAQASFSDQPSDPAFLLFPYSVSRSDAGRRRLRRGFA